MASTPDRKPGPLEEDDEIRFVANPTSPTQAGAFNYDGTSFVMRDPAGNFNPRNDHKAKVSSADTTADFLESKLVAGANVTLTKLNPGGNETIRISVSSAPTCCAQILMSINGTTFSAQLPMAAPSGGLMTNDNGFLLVVG